MKIDKNKLIIGSVLLVIILFIIAYSVIALGNDSEESEGLQQTEVPELKEEQEEFKSKLDAINALKEVRQTDAPSIYDEKFLDSLGYFDPELEDKNKQWLVDSIYNSDYNNYYQPPEDYFISEEAPEYSSEEIMETVLELPFPLEVITQELGLQHQLFFSSVPAQESELENINREEKPIYAEVDGEQVVKVNSRLSMRLTTDIMIGDVLFKKNSRVYGFVSFKPNRAIIKIENINQHPVKLKAFDLQDGSEGIYVENSFRAEATREVIGDIVQDINIPGIPQIGGIKRIFQTNNRNVKVTIANNYKLILKKP